MNAMLEGLQQGHHQAFGGIGQRMTFDNDAGAHHNKSAREMAGRCVRKEFHLNVYCLTCFKQSDMDNVSLYVTRRVTFGPNAQMTSLSKMTLK